MGKRKSNNTKEAPEQESPNRFRIRSQEDDTSDIEERGDLSELDMYNDEGNDDSDSLSSLPDSRDTNPARELVYQEANTRMHTQEDAVMLPPRRQIKPTEKVQNTQFSQIYKRKELDPAKTATRAVQPISKKQNPNASLAMKNTHEKEPSTNLPAMTKNPEVPKPRMTRMNQTSQVPETTGKKTAQARPGARQISKTSRLPSLSPLRSPVLRSPPRQRPSLVAARDVIRANSRSPQQRRAALGSLPILLKQKTKAFLGKGKIAVESDEQSQNAGPIDMRRRQFQDSMVQDLDDLSRGEFQRRSIMLMLGLLEESTKQTKLLAKIVAQGAKQEPQNANTDESDRDYKAKLGKLVMPLARKISTVVSMYPTAVDIQTSVIKFLGCTSLQEAHRRHSSRDVTITFSKVLDKFSKVIRPSASAIIKSITQSVYAKHMPELITVNENGQQRLNRSLIKELQTGHQHRCGIGASPEFMPYSCPAFREVAVTTFRKGHEKEADNWTTEKPITWLGRGQVAFADCLVLWILKGNEEILKVSEEAKCKEYQKMYADALKACDDVGDTTELAFSVGAAIEELA